MAELCVWQVGLEQAFKVSPGFVCPLETLKLFNWALVFTGSFEVDERPAVRENLGMVSPEPSAPSVTRKFGLPKNKRDKKVCNGVKQ